MIIEGSISRYPSLLEEGSKETRRRIKTEEKEWGF